MNSQTNAKANASLNKYGMWTGAFAFHSITGGTKNAGNAHQIQFQTNNKQPVCARTLKKYTMQMQIDAAPAHKTLSQTQKELVAFAAMAMCLIKVIIVCLQNPSAHPTKIMCPKPIVVNVNLALFVWDRPVVLDAALMKSGMEINVCV